MEFQPTQESHYHNLLLPYNKQSMKKSKRNKVHSKSINVEDELDSEEKKKDNLKYMNVLEDLSRLRDHYYSVYLSKLEAKVEKQRKEIKAREEKAKQLLLRREADKNKKAHQVVHRLPKVVLKNDTEYLRQVPKSRYYHLIAVEELMKSRGLLKHKSQLDEFWLKASRDRNIWSQNLPPTLSPDRLTEHMLLRYSSLTTQSKIGLIPDPNKNQVNPAEVLPGILKQTSEDSDEEEAAEERARTPPLVFPVKPKFPKLHSFKMNLVASKLHVPSIAPSQEEERGRQSPKRSRRKLEHQLRRDAYEVAVVNTAMTGRLMTRHNVKVKSLKPMSEITEMWCGQSETSSFSSKTTQSKDTAYRRSRKTKSKKTIASEQPPAVEHSLNVIDEQPEVTDDFECEPLSMDQMISTGNISLKKVKMHNPFWTNYVTSDDNQMIEEEAEELS